MQIIISFKPGPRRSSHLPKERKRRDIRFIESNNRYVQKDYQRYGNQE